MMSNDRVYPRDSPLNSGEHAKLVSDTSPPNSGVYHHHHPSGSQESFTSSKASSYPPSGTYVIQVPKDQIYRVPPPENAHKYQLYTRRRTRGRSPCRRCFCATLGTFLLLATLLIAAAGIFYLIVSPKAPEFSVERVAVKGINLTAARASMPARISPVFNVTVKVGNNNGKIGIFYLKGSSVIVYHDGVKLCDGELPAFYQPPKNVTVFNSKFTGAGIVLSKSSRQTLINEQNQRKVPLKLDVKVPVKIKVGSVTTWGITVKVTCDVAVNGLTETAKVVSKECKAKVKVW